jgi:hypothetical protein
MTSSKVGWDFQNVRSLQDKNMIFNIIIWKQNTRYFLYILKVSI